MVIDLQQLSKVISKLGRDILLCVAHMLILFLHMIFPEKALETGGVSRKIFDYVRLASGGWGEYNAAGFLVMLIL
jgi:hypothetical protein